MAVVLMATASASADYVSDNLLLYLDAGDSDGDGVQGLGSGYATWVNKGSTGATNDASPLGNVLWVGDGSAANPYAMRFTQTAPYSYPSTSQAHAVVNNSGSGSTLDNSVYTYEVWAEINGPGSGQGNPGPTHVKENATLISSYSDTYAGGGGHGMINYTLAGAWTGVPDIVYSGDTWAGTEIAWPGSNGIIGDGLMHQFVLTRAGGGATDTSCYIDGVYQGSFQTTDCSAEMGMVVGGRHAASQIA